MSYNAAMHPEPDPRGEPVDQDERIRSLEARLFAYETDARRVTGELLRLRGERAHNTGTSQLLREMQLALSQIQATKFFKIRTSLRRFAARLGVVSAPANPFDFSPRIASVLDDADAYARWRQRNEPRSADLELMRRTCALWPVRPKISILVPVYETPEPYLRAMFDSVLTQVYPNWQLCVADDASPSAYVRAVIEEYRSRDPRISVVYRETNGHIVRASNDALRLADGEYVALLDHDDVLAPHALFRVALAALESPDADMLYSDEDKLDEDGRRWGPMFKPDWSPDTFLTRMYTSHLGVYRRRLVADLGGFRAGFDGSQDYDLVLRVTEKTNRIVHIPDVLYHWRVHKASVAGDAASKPYAYEAAVRALNEAMARRDEGGRVEPLAGDPGHYTVRFAIRRYERVSIIIPTRDHGVDVDRCLHGVFEASTYPQIEVILLDNGSRERSSLATFERWRRLEPERLHVVRYDVEFNFAKLNNYAVRQSSGTYVLFLNNDTEAITRDWIDAMVEQAQRPSIGAVGAKLLYADQRVQHAGVVIGIGGIAGHAFRFAGRYDPGHIAALKAVTNYSAVTAACMMMRRSVFDEVGGFDEDFAVAYNDVDLCLRVVRAGYRIVYLPHAELFHYESKSRGYDTTNEQRARDLRERELMQHKWDIAAFRDPCYNPNLTLEREDFSIAP